MEKITNIEEKEKIVNTLYSDNWVLDLKVRDIKWYNNLMSKYDIYKTDDNYALVVDLDKPEINKTLWFDDEQPIPDLSEKLFINYNMHNIRYDLDDNKPLFIYHAHRNNKLAVTVSQDGYSRIVDTDEFVRRLNDEEATFIKTIYNQFKNDYIERLKKYFKRYASNINVSGYWVNR
ncbi:MAG: hypothetical protein WC343_02855 [Bacilli bacterium]|jgi:hypothetical protein